MAVLPPPRVRGASALVVTLVLCLLVLAGLAFLLLQLEPGGEEGEHGDRAVAGGHVPAGAQMQVPEDGGASAKDSNGAEPAELRSALVAQSAGAVAELRWSGRVVDALDDGPVAGARVLLGSKPHRFEALTDATGAFELRAAADVATRLSIRHADYVDARSADVQLDAPGHFELTPSAILGGWVEPAPEEGSAQAIVWASIASSTRSWKKREVEIDAQGRFEFRDLTPGEYALTARIPGRHVASEAGLRLEAGEKLDVPLETRMGSNLRGRVYVRGSAQAVVAARLSASTRDPGLPREHREDSIRSTQSDGRGAYEIQGLGPGTWRLEVATPWGSRETREVEVSESGDSIALDVELHAPASVHGSVVDAAGRPASGVELVAIPSRWRDPLRAVVAGGSSDGLARTLSAADGTFELEAVPARTTLSLFARRPGRDEAESRSVPGGFVKLPQLEPGARSVGVEVVLSPDSALAGVVLGLDGTPIQGASVKAHAFLDGNWLVVGRDRSGSDGRFEMRDLCSTTLNLQVEHEDHLQLERPVELGGPDLELRLEPATVVHGRALDARGLGIPDLPVAATGCDAAGNTPEDRDERVIHRSRTNSYGEFSLRGLPDGHWLVIGSSYEWRQLASSPQLLSTPGDREIVLSMTPRERPLRASLSGSVVLARGGVPSGVEVRGLRGGVVSIDGGHFKATGLVPTRHNLTVDADGHAARRVRRVDLRPGQLHELGSIELQPATRLVVRVRDAAGKPVDGARVRLGVLPAEKDGAGEGARALGLRRIAPGRYESDDATHHAWRLVVERKGWKRASRRLVVRDQERQSIEVVLERSAD